MDLAYRHAGKPGPAVELRPHEQAVEVGKQALVCLVVVDGSDARPDVLFEVAQVARYGGGRHDLELVHLGEVVAKRRTYRHGLAVSLQDGGARIELVACRVDLIVAHRGR